MIRHAFSDNHDDHPYAGVHLFIYHNDTQVLSCNPLYIGLLGMQIASGPLIYPKNTRLEIRFSVPTPQGMKEYRIAAAVTASSRDGLGLTFDNRRGNQSRDVLEILNYLPQAHGLIQQPSSNDGSYLRGQAAAMAAAIHH